jgi:nitrogen-specific signal transduction histidine kinase/ActR/RegA family two-component response regulator
MAGELREMRDSLEQKVRERTAKLKATQSELVQAAKLSALGQLVSGVAHEINNPLTSILGYSELVLRRPELDARLRVHLQTIRDEAVRLKSLVANLSSFARRQPQRIERVDLRQVLDRLVELRQYQLNASNIELHYDRPADPVWVEGDRDQLLQVFFNLVLNSEQAIGSSRAKGDIWLACGVHAGRPWATVGDNGTGMSLALQERIFDPFFTTKPVGQGAGLGLSISHGIIQQHHGTIAAESAEGQGTTMRISLPAAVPASEVPPAPLQTVVENNAGTASGLRALIIDDEPTIAQMIQQFLESQGWTHIVLNDSTAVDSSLEGQHFDLVICDLKMPGRNGLEVLRLLHQKRPELARCFLLMTGHLAEAQEKEILELAGVPVLPKPFTLAQLADAVRILVPNRDEPYKD